MNKTVRMLCACFLIFTLLVSMAACGKTQPEPAEPTVQTAGNATQAVYTAKAGSLKKTETVYVNLQNDGKVQNISVSDWLHTDVGQVCVDDISDLKNIQNVKSDVSPVIKGEKLQWHMPSTDIYYSGDTDKKPPVELTFSYYLNGKKMTAAEMAGKSGQVKIEVNMKNTLSKTVTVGDEKIKVYLPVLVVGGMIMEEDAFTGITVENGRSIGDGSKEIVAFFGMPGMTESLGLNTADLSELGITVSDTASVTAATDCFELGNMYFAALPLASLNLGIEAPQSTEDLQSAFSILKEVQKTVTSLDPDAVLSALISDSGSVNSLLSVVTDAVTLYQDNKALIEVMGKYMSGENGRQLTKLLELLGSSETGVLLDFLTKYDITKMMSGLQGIEESMPLLNALSADLNTPEVQKALDALPETMEKLNALRGTLEENRELIDSLTDMLDSDNMQALSALADALEKADLSSLAEKYAGLTENAGNLVERAGAWLTFGKSYGLFTKAPEGAQTAVTFVYMTPSVKVKVSAPTPAVPEEKETRKKLWQ